MVKNALAALLLVAFVFMSVIFAVKTARVLANVAEMQFEHDFALAHPMR